MDQRQWPVGVIQICWIDPDPSISAIVKVCPALISTLGLPFHPPPNSREAPDPVPVVAFPPPPFAPSKFSGLMLRVLAGESWYRLLRFDPTPLKGVWAPARPVVIAVSRRSARCFMQ